MKLITVSLTTMLSAMLLASCSTPERTQEFRWTVDRFADCKVMRYQVPGFDDLSLRQK